MKNKVINLSYTLWQYSMQEESKKINKNQQKSKKNQVPDVEQWPWSLTDLSDDL